MSQKQSQSYRAEIDAEYRRYKADEAVLHNKEMHQHILATWKRGSPKMWANLEALGLTEKMAYVAQERMWRRSDELLKQGFPVTDAREIAEREELMLEPEEPMPDNSDLPTVLQDAPPNLRARWRAERAEDVTPAD